MSEPIRSISEGTFVIGDTNGLTFEAGPGISVSQPSEGTVRIANDETVLWSNANGSSTIQFSESISNFDRLRFKIKTDQGFQYFEIAGQGSELVLMYPHGSSNAWTTWLLLRYDSSTYTITVTHSKSIRHSFTANTTTLGSELDTHLNDIVEVRGINRISGGNNE